MHDDNFCSVGAVEPAEVIAALREILTRLEAEQGGETAAA
jgi:hypothetical protein